MKLYFTALLAIVGIFTQAQSTTLLPGQTAPAFQLKNVDGKQVSFSNYPTAKGYIVVFTCNTCPYAKAYEQRVIELNNKYAPLGFPVIAINTNDPVASAGDSFEKMQERAKAAKYSFPYLYDEGQTVTTAYGATRTPHIFLVRKSSGGNTIEYTGALDNDSEGTNSDRKKYVEQAIEALEKGNKPSVTVTKAIGCTIKWKITT